MQPLSHDAAYALVKAALESGSIKMAGSNGVVEPAVRMGQADAAYLLALMNGLTAQPQQR